MNAYTSSLSGASTPYQYRPQSMTGIATPMGRDRGLGALPTMSEGLFGRQAEILDPFFQPSGQVFSQLSSLLSGGGLGGVDPRMQRSFGMAEGGIGQLLGGQALSQMLAPTLQRFQEQVLPQTLSQVAGRGMSRGRSAIPGYATKAAERLGMDALAQQAGLIPQALQIAQGLAGMPSNAFLQGLQQLVGARGTTFQRPALPGAIPETLMALQQQLTPQGQPAQSGQPTDLIGLGLQMAPSIGALATAIPGIGPILGPLIGMAGTIGGHYYNKPAAPAAPARAAAPATPIRGRDYTAQLPQLNLPPMPR